MAKLLNKDEQWVEEEVESYTTLARQYILEKN
jgi:hypothetical protein